MLQSPVRDSSSHDISKMDPKPEPKAKGLSSGEKRIEKYIYSMTHLLGKGSFASVFLGRSIADGTEVAVKVIDRKIFANQYNLKNIQSEIEIMKKMHHKNIVKLLDVYQTTNNLYIITEFCPGGDIRTLIQERRKIPQPEALLLLKDIVEGFRYLNSQGVTHRDLKPANILLIEGKCKISDFGFAKNLQFGEDTILRSIVGTPLYMSPQILNQQPYTSKSDIWSVGLIYYELLHGFTPWPATNELQLINSIMTRPVVYAPAISEKSKDFIRLCLKRREEDRISWEDVFTHPIITADHHMLPRRNSFKKQQKENRSPLSTFRSRINSKSPISRNQLTNRNGTPERKWK